MPIGATTKAPVPTGAFLVVLILSEPESIIFILFCSVLSVSDCPESPQTASDTPPT